MAKATKHILCLDDNHDTRELVTRMLQAEGHQIAAVGTIAEALHLIEADRFALYIVDEWLPDGSGVEFIRRLRDAGSTVPILVHSAAAFRVDIDSAMAAGANDYVVKPNGWFRLLSVVTELMNQNGECPPSAACRPAAPVNTP